MYLILFLLIICILYLKCNIECILQSVSFSQFEFLMYFAYTALDYDYVVGVYKFQFIFGRKKKRVCIKFKL